MPSIVCENEPASQAAILRLSAFCRIEQAAPFGALASCPHMRVKKRRDNLRLLFGSKKIPAHRDLISWSALLLQRAGTK